MKNRSYLLAAYFTRIILSIILLEYYQSIRLDTKLILILSIILPGGFPINKQTQ